MTTAQKKISLRFALCAGLFGLLQLGACHRPAPEKNGSVVVNNAEATLIMLSEAKAWQRRADLHLSDGDVAAAIAATKEVLNIPFTEGAAEAEDVRLDACTRLAKLYLGQGPSEEAEERALAQLEAGRKLASHDSFFRAHIEMVTADVYEARANRLTDAEAKKAEKRKAIEALDRAIQIDRRVQRALLNLPEGGSTRAEAGAGDNR